MPVGHKQYLTFNGLNLTSQAASEVRLAFAGKEVDTSVIGTAWEGSEQGQVGASYSVNGVWAAGTAATALDAVLFAALTGGTKLIEYMPNGSASASILYKSNGYPTAYEVGGGVADRVGFSASLKVSDTVVRSVTA